MIKNCAICGEEVEVKRYKTNLKGEKPEYIQYSDNGFYFEDDDVWFCNKCYKKLTKDVDIEKIIQEELR